MGYREYYGGGFAFPRWNKAVKTLLIANGIVFLFQWVAGQQFILLFGLVPQHFWKNFHVWQVVTYMFLHGGIWHILLNMYALWLFGSELEATWGEREFYKYYFITGVGAGLLTVITSPNSLIPTIGASGAIFGILIAFGMLFPDRIIYLNFFFPIKAKYLVILFGIFELLSSFRHTSDGIAHFAHLGGMVIGFLYLKGDWRFQSLFQRLKSSKPKITVRRTAEKKKKREDIQAEVDRILFKISKEGMDSLTEEEQEILDEASRLYKEQ
jgi:membrane associated rhomboid family serine protease